MTDGLFHDMIHALAEHHGHHSNPLASRSRAALSFHAGTRNFPGGNTDIIRFLENEAWQPWIDKINPEIKSKDDPIIVHPLFLRESVANRFITNDKVLDTIDDPSFWTVIESVKHRSSVDTGDIEKELDGIVDISPRSYSFSVRNGYDYCNVIRSRRELMPATHSLTITKIPTCVGFLESLESLDVSRSNVSKIEVVDALPGLKKLDVSSTKVSRIENLENNVNLEELILDGTPVSKIEGLDTLTRLKHLSITSTGIERLENIEKNEQLKTITNQWQKEPLKASKSIIDLVKSRGIRIVT